MRLEFDFTRRTSEHGVCEMWTATVPDMGVVDERGRTVGYTFSIQRWSTQPVAEGWRLFPHVLRDGQKYGGMPTWHEAQSVEELKDLAARILAKRAKEYSKKFKKKEQSK
jgi:hypothetical protein